MRFVWRLAPPEYAHELGGEGGKLFGGRWNSRGRNALYAASYLSLNVLEVYVNIPPDLRDDLPILQAVRIAIPADTAVTQVSQEQLAAFMAAPNPMAASRRQGDDWLDRSETLVLEVPSVVVPEETNLVLNPAHPRMREVRIVSSRPFRFDPRLVVPKA
jgi:RES domain-containing protein